MKKKILVGAISPDISEPDWLYKEGVKYQELPPRSAYARNVFKALQNAGFDVVEDFGETFGKNSHRKDIDCVLAIHACRSQPAWQERFAYFDKLCKNVWCVKDSHLNFEYVDFDRLGFSGGNSYAIDPTKWGDISEEDLGEAEKIHNYLFDKYALSNESKYSQPDKKNFKNKPFVLFAGQMCGDTSIHFTNFKGYLPEHNPANYQRTVWIALNELNKWGVNILYKSHPGEFGEWSWSVREIIKSGIWENCSLIDGIGIHELLEQCLGVVTINSGSGFEGLLHLKPVVTLGKVDYSIATHHCETREDIAVAKDFVLNPDSSHQDFIKKFLLRFHKNRFSEPGPDGMAKYVTATSHILNNS